MDSRAAEKKSMTVHVYCSPFPDENGLFSFFEPRERLDNLLCSNLYGVSFCNLSLADGLSPQITISLNYLKINLNQTVHVSK